MLAGIENTFFKNLSTNHAPSLYIRGAMLVDAERTCRGTRGWRDRSLLVLLCTCLFSTAAGGAGGERSPVLRVRGGAGERLKKADFEQLERAAEEQTQVCDEFCNVYVYAYVHR